MGFWRFQSQPGPPGPEWISSLDPHLVALTGLLMFFAAYLLILAVERVRVSESVTVRQGWLLTGACCMAAGFWATEAISILGLGLPVPVHLDWRLSLLGIIPAVIGSLTMILALSDPRSSPLIVHGAALCFPVGLLGLHISIMEAVNVRADFTYSPRGWLLALGYGYAMALATVYFGRFTQRAPAVRTRTKVVSSFLCAGVALGIHYAAYWSTHYWAAGGNLDHSLSFQSTALIPASCIIVTLMVGLLFLGTVGEARATTAVEALQRSELRNRAVIRTMLDAHIIFDSKGRVTDFNPAAEAMFGFSSAEILGRNVTCLMGAISEERFGEWLAADSGIARNVPLFTRMIRPEGARRSNGELFPVEYGITSFVGNGGREFSCVLRDLSDQWATLHKLETLAGAVEFSGDGIAILNRDSSVSYVNPQFELQHGVSGPELIGRPAAELNRTSTIIGEGMLTAMASGQSWTGRTIAGGVDCQSYEEDVLLTPIRSSRGEITAYVAVFHDVTVRVANARENARLAAAVRYAADSIEILGADGRIEYVNPAYEANQNARLRDVVGRRPEDIEKVLVQDGNYYAMLAASRDEGRTWTGILQSELSQGRVLEELVTVSPIRDERNTVTSFVIVKRDVTETRRLESQLQRARKLESIGQLAAGVAHEINTPTHFVGDNLAFLRESFRALTPILARLAADATEPGPAEYSSLREMAQGAELDFLFVEIPKAIDQSLEGCDRITRIVQAMKVFSHPGTGMTAVDLNRAIQSTITVASSEWRYVAEISIDLDPTLPLVVCQVGEMNQVVLNLLVNAAHAISDRPEKRGIISVATKQCDAGVEITVTDTGVGIPAAIRERIFDPFFTTKEVGKGTGQGLAIAYDVVVHKHRGSIEVESEVGRGTTFRIRLPLVPPDAAQSLAA